MEKSNLLKRLTFIIVEAVGENLRDYTDSGQEEELARLEDARKKLCAQLTEGQTALFERYERIRDAFEIQLDFDNIFFAGFFCAAEFYEQRNNPLIQKIIDSAHEVIARSNRVQGETG